MYLAIGLKIKINYSSIYGAYRREICIIFH